MAPSGISLKCQLENLVQQCLSSGKDSREARRQVVRVDDWRTLRCLEPANSMRTTRQIGTATSLSPRIGNHNSPGIVTGLRAVGDDDRLGRSDRVFRSSNWRTVQAEIINAVEGQQTRHRGLVDLRSDGIEVGLGGVGRSIGDCRNVSGNSFAVVIGCLNLDLQVAVT